MEPSAPISLPVSKRSFLSVLVPAEVLIFPQAAVCIHFRPPAALAADDWQLDALRCQPRITRICLKANDIQRYITKIAVKQTIAAMNLTEYSKNTC